MNKKIKIAIHRRERSFSDYWIDWCEKNNVDYKIVDAYDSDIIKNISDCDGFMWHWHQDSYADQLFARQLTFAITGMGIKVFPDVNTSWHFDDKLGQKYLFESIGLPHINTYVFYQKGMALSWINNTTYPIVFKLRGGAGSNNVKKVRNKRKAKYYIKKAFGSGFSAVDVYEVAWQALWEYKRDKKIIKLFRFGYYLFRAIAGIKPTSASLREKQRGYVYFQEYIANNTYDDRMVVVGKKCFCIRRMCRENDFRASGSGVIKYDHTIFPIKSIELAFMVAKKIGSQSVAMDLVYDNNKEPRVVEISYCFTIGKSYEDCDGYFNESLEWINKKVTPQVFMIEDFVESIGAKINDKCSDLN
jgi:glutathione synthase/RimK-type ligase-like ATP-grasp enzyme